jgi:single-stranded-DNA-specific exonuclease
LKVSALVAQVLINRGIVETIVANSFLKPKLSSLIEPEKMPGAKQAVERLKHAIKSGKKITIYGDYDVDGITGVSILWQVLTLLGSNVNFYIPHRIEEGYGLNEDAVRSLADDGTQLLITVDCGANAINTARLCKELGIELIVTDHHQLNEQLPDAACIVHPALDEDYPNQDSSGSLVAFKLAWAVANEFGGTGKLKGAVRQFMLDATSLAAMGTVADVMDLRGENRVLTSFGLKALPNCSLEGIKALIDSANLNGEALDSFHIGFRLAPMLNAAGRMGHARLAVELLTTACPVRSKQIAEYLKQQNNKRQFWERKILKQAREMIEQKGLDSPRQKTIVLWSDDWHTGVIGIVASRIVDKFYRPTILINTAAADSPQSRGLLAEDARRRGIAQGSARSIEGFDILSAIRACSEHLVSFGGHKAAAGLTLKPEKIERFSNDFESYAQQKLVVKNLVSKLNVDALVQLKEFNKDIIQELRLLEPFGQGNPEPVFATKAVRLAGPPKPCGSGGSHLQLVITDRTATVRCIGFGMGELSKQLLEKDCFDVAYRPQINSYNGMNNVELVLNDIQLD